MSLFRRSLSALRRPLDRHALLVLALAACADPGPPTGSLRLALAPDLCADFCLEALNVSLTEEGTGLPLGASLQVACSAGVTIEALPAGVRLAVTVDAYDITGEILLSGGSDPLTVAAATTTEAVVRLAPRARPVVTSASPDPLLLSAAPVTLTLGGTFGEPLGKSQVELDGTPLDAATWLTAPSGDTLTIAVPPATHAAEVVVRRCGVASEPFPVRLVGDTLGSSAVIGTPNCPGGEAAAAVTTDHEVLVAWRCADPALSQLVRFLQDAELCPLDAAGALSLAAAPTALATSTNAAFIALRDASGNSIAKVALADLSTADPPLETWSLASTESTLGLGVVDDVALALLGDGTHEQVVRLDPSGVLSPALSPGGGFDEYRMSALATSPTHAWIAARTAQGAGRLIAVTAAGTATAYPIDCPAPTTLAASNDGTQVALACQDGAYLWSVSGQRGKRLPGFSAPPSALVFDTPSDVLFVAGSSLEIVLASSTPSTLATFPAATPRLTALGDHRLLAWDTTTSRLEVWTPYDPLGPCAEAP